jgi:hypothetical protein
MYRSIRHAVAVLIPLAFEPAWAVTAQDTAAPRSCECEVANGSVKLVIAAPATQGQGPDDLRTGMTPKMLGSRGLVGERNAEQAARQQRERDFLYEIWTSP